MPVIFLRHKATLKVEADDKEAGNIIDKHLKAGDVRISYEYPMEGSMSSCMSITFDKSNFVEGSMSARRLNDITFEIDCDFIAKIALKQWAMEYVDSEAILFVHGICCGGVNATVVGGNGCKFEDCQGKLGVVFDGQIAKKISDLKPSNCKASDPRIKNVYYVGFGVVPTKLNKKMEEDLIDHLSAGATFLEAFDGRWFCYIDSLKCYDSYNKAIQDNAAAICGTLNDNLNTNYDKELLGLMASSSMDKKSDVMSNYISENGGKLVQRSDSSWDKKKAGSLFCMVTAYDDVTAVMKKGVIVVDNSYKVRINADKVRTNEYSFDDLTGLFDNGDDFFSIYVK